MATTQTLINAGTVAAQVLPYDAKRVFMYIRNYSGSAQTIWLAFGKTATAGSAGELEIPPGVDFVWGGDRRYSQRHPRWSNNCPLESISVITSTGSATGCVMVIS